MGWSGAGSKRCSFETLLGCTGECWRHGGCLHPGEVLEHHSRAPRSPCRAAACPSTGSKPAACGPAAAVTAPVRPPGCAHAAGLLETQGKGPGVQHGSPKAEQAQPRPLLVPLPSQPQILSRGDSSTELSASLDFWRGLQKGFLFLPKLFSERGDRLLLAKALPKEWGGNLGTNPVAPHPQARPVVVAVAC